MVILNPKNESLTTGKARSMGVKKLESSRINVIVISNPLKKF
jgi:hypothetical protein